MRPLRYLTIASSLAMLCTGVSVGASSAQKESAPRSPSGPGVPAATAALPSRASFAGVWAYNEQDSMNAASGRTENSPGATHRTGTITASDGAPGPLGGPASSGNGLTGFGASSSSVPSAFASLIVNEKRDLVRDLLEVPTELKIKLTDSAITFVDHLDREMTYPTTGKKQKYQLSASVFEAKAYWDGPQLKKEIEGSEGFRMREVYFLSEDGKRLFVIVRVGDLLNERDNTDVVGVNRVYDRVGR